MVIAAVALIVVGPKDLPMLLRKLGRFTARLRDMASEFRASFDEMARQTELDELRKEVEAMRRGQLVDQATRDATTVEVDQVFEDISRGLGEGSYQLHPPMSHQYAEVTDLPPPEVVEAAKPKRARKAAAKPGAKTAPKPRKPRKKAETPA